MKMKKILGAMLLAISFGVPAFVFAVDVSGTPPATASVQLQNPIKANTFTELAAMVTKAAVNILMPFVVLGFIYSGFLFVKAQGNEKGLEEAKKSIYWSVIGAFILFGAWGFAQLISQTIATVTN